MTKIKPRILLNIVLSAAVLVVAGLAVWLMLAHSRQPERRVRPKMITKVLAPPIKPTFERSVEIVGFGSARPHVQLAITPQVTGIVVEKADNYLSGKYVRKGQMLCRIDRTDYDLAVQRAQSRIDLLKAQLARLEQEQKNLVESQRIETGLVKLADVQLRRV
ncbi:MAG: biotin/lipoyl-binding protein, partial [Phycisphaerae bacterium]|nr:biotin/lipoyl-binding protein [Phycisphaerae bacterium]